MNTEKYSGSVTPQKKRSLRPTLGMVVALLSTPVWAVPLMGATSAIFTSGFESGFSGWDQQLCCKHSGQIVSSPTRNGRNAAKFTLRRSDFPPTEKARAEIKLDPVPPSSEWTYRFSTFVGANYKKDPSYEIITQWHNRPDPGENWTIPPMSLVVENDRFRVSNRWDTRQITPKRGGESQRWDLGPITKGQWVDWVFHVKWSYQSNGLLEVWKDGKLVIKKTGPNTYNNKTGPFLKMGIYKPQWKADPSLSTVNERIVYFDAVQIQKH